MKLKIKEAGVFDQSGAEIAIGTMVEAEGENVPGWLAGKCEVIAEEPAIEEAVAVVNPKGKG